jgi:hypothetical protein
VLFLAAAILSASIHVFGVVEAPPATPVSAASATGTGPVATSALALERVCVVDGAGDLDGARCLGELTRASSASLDGLRAALDPVGDDIGATSSALTADVAPSTVLAWWESLGEARQHRLAMTLPGLVGNLEGVPYDVRDEANRAFLDDAADALDSRLAGGSARPDDVSRAAMLDEVGAALADRTSGAAGRRLIALDTVMPGRAAVAIGDLDTADDVSVLVPGMLFTVSGQMVDWSETAGDLYDEQSTWATLLAGRSADAPHTTAVVAWMGYRTPDLTNVYSLDLARVGAAHLDDAIAGLDAVRADDPARVTVVAHSYGSTAATMALSSGRVTVDSLVLLGSPGSVVETATQLAVEGSDVYAAAGSFDPVAGSGAFGADPGSTAFGAVMLHTGGGADGLTGQALSAALGHNDYLRAGTESLRSIALIGLGRGELVDVDERTPGTGGPELPDITLVRPQDLYVRD